MFPFGHVGFTLAVAEAVRGRFAVLRSVPLLVVALGALLPDILDKPFAFGVLHADSGRLLGHTIAFAAALAAGAIILRGRARGILAALAFGAAMHLVLDRVWETPRLLLWPLLGAELPVDAERADRLALDVPLAAYTLATESLGLLLIGWTFHRARLRAGIIKWRAHHGPNEPGGDT